MAVWGSTVTIEVRRDCDFQFFTPEILLDFPHVASDVTDTRIFLDKDQLECSSSSRNPT